MSEQLNAVEEVRRLFQHICSSEDSKGKSVIEPIFVSFDAAHGNKKGFSAIGVFILDSRCFAGSMTRKLEDHNHSLLWTHTYIFHYGTQGVRWAQKRALFHGGAQKVTASDRMPLLRRIFSYHEEEDVEPCCRSQKFQPFQPSARKPQSRSKAAADARPIIVVGRSIPQDVRSLSKAGFDIAQVAPIVVFKDTQKIARELYWKENRSKTYL